ncbi:hypothetical protein TruAng_001240 [Truncatella angustata]|nr:hypothetical protein TruAng_001240 [Truncatella angustata]
MEIQRIRTLWGVAPGEDLKEWKKLFPVLKQVGYDGIEVDVTGVDPMILPALRALADEHDFVITVLIHTAWPSYVGPRPSGLTPDDHLQYYRKYLQLAKILRPIKVNAQSGSDILTPDQSVEFYQKTFAVDEELGFSGRVCHETHRNRSMFNPQVADYILKRVPNLRITTDISHWVVVSERLLDGPEDNEILERVLPHVEHIHARMGTTQASQCPEPTNPVFKDERKFFEGWWLRILEWRLKNEDLRPITFVPEYGP